MRRGAARLLAPKALARAFSCELGIPMRATLLLLAILALGATLPAAEATHGPECPKIVWYERCPWPGGVGELCVNFEEHKVCFGPI